MQTKGTLQHIQTPTLDLSAIDTKLNENVIQFYFISFSQDYVQVNEYTGSFKKPFILDCWIVFEEFALKLKFFSLVSQWELDTFVSWTSINSGDVV